jgi:type I restriction enzyme S subunit
VKRIGDVTSRVSKWTPQRSGQLKMFDYIDLSAVNNEHKHIAHPARVSTTEAPSRARQLVAAGDVLVSTVRPNLNAVAVVPAGLDGATASTGFTVLRPTKDVDGRYLFHWVRSASFINDMTRKSTGASYPAVSDRIVFGSVLPLPSLDEQRRIATILDHADALRAKRHAARDLYTDLGTSVFVAMFGGSNVGSKPLRALASVITKGTTPTSVGLKFADFGIPFLRVQDLRDVSVRPGSQTLYVDEATHRSLARSVVRPGDLLVSIAGTIGRCAVVPADSPEMNCNQAVAIVRPLDESAGPWLATWLNTPGARRQLSASSVTATISNLSLAQLGALQVPDVAARERIEFTRRLSDVQRACDRCDEGLRRQDALYVSIQDRVFARAP